MLRCNHAFISMVDRLCTFEQLVCAHERVHFAVRAGSGYEPSLSSERRLPTVTPSPVPTPEVQAPYQGQG